MLKDIHNFLQIIEFNSCLHQPTVLETSTAMANSFDCVFWETKLKNVGFRRVIFPPCRVPQVSSNYLQVMIVDMENISYITGHQHYFFRG